MKNKIIKNKISENYSSKNIYVLASIAILSVFLFVGIGSAAFCVGNVTNSGDCTSNKTYTTIQDAIDEVPIGGWILIAEGIYNETLDLNGSEVTIKGEGPGKTIINASASGDMGPAIYNFGYGTNILNLKLIGSNDYGFKISHVNNITLENIEVTGSSKTGIDFNSVNDTVIKNVKVENNGGAGIALRNMENVLVDGLETSGNSLGGLALWAPNSSADAVNPPESLINITIIDSVFSNEIASGIFVQHDGIFENIIIKNNVFKNNTLGLFIENSSEMGTPDVTGFILKQNTFKDNINESVINSGHGKLDLINNFWGSSSPNFNESISGDTILIPFCTDPDCNESSIGDSSEVEMNFSTPVGINVTLDAFGGKGFPGGVSIKFSNTTNVTGFRSVKISTTPPAPSSSPNGFKIIGNYFDVSIDDLGTEVNICFTPISGQVDSQTKLLHFESGSWIDVTGEVNSGTNTVCSTLLSSLSPFVLANSESDSSGSSSSGSSGSSNTGGSGGVCMTEWTCTEWNECSGGEQTRNCSYPENYCEPGESKPAEFRECEMQEEEVVNEEESGEFEVEESENSGVLTTMTGAVIGTNTGKGIGLAALFILMIGLTYAIVRKKDK